MKTMRKLVHFLSISGTCLLSVTSLSASASQLPDYPFIHAVGNAYIFVAPNLGELDFEINVPEVDPEASVATALKRIDDIQQLLNTQGIGAEDVTIRGLRKEMRKQGADDVYNLRSAIHITVRDLSKWRHVVLPLLNMPNVDSLEATFGTTEREKLERDLMNLAVKDAQNKADAMASAFGKRVGTVSAISSNQLKDLSTSIGLVPGDLYLRDREPGANEAHGTVNPADLLMIAGKRMSQSVDVVFRIK